MTSFSVKQADRDGIAFNLAAFNGSLFFKQQCEDDTALACRVIETLQSQRAQRAGPLRLPSRSLLYKVVGEHANYYVIHFRDCIDIISDEDVSHICALSTRVLDVRIITSRRKVCVQIARSGAAEPQQALQHVAPAIVKEAHACIAWDSARVSDADDKRNINSIIGDVYNIESRIPDINFWFEPIVDAKAAPEAWKLPLTDALSAAASSADASESTDVADAAPESQRAGYALCFANMPNISGAFLQHLCRTYGPVVARAYVWLQPPPHVCGTPLFVVNVRRTLVSSNAAARATNSHLPRGDPTLPRRASKRKRGANTSGHPPQKRIK